LLPSFKNNAVLSFVPVLNNEANFLVTLLAEFVDGGEINLLPELNKWSFKIAARK